MQGETSLAPASLMINTDKKKGLSFRTALYSATPATRADVHLYASVYGTESQLPLLTEQSLSLRLPQIQPKTKPNLVRMKSSFLTSLNPKLAHPKVDVKHA
jgi:hypothetical protein